MNDTNISIIVEDSKHNRFLFSYHNQSIYCKEISANETARDTMLVNQVNNDFQTTIDSEDNLYLVCYSMNKGIMIFTYEQNVWRFQEVLSVQGNSGVNLIHISIINKSLNIIYAKRLPIANFYNIFHITNSRSSFSNSSWKKYSITEVYAENLANAVSCVTTGNESLHLANVWFNGTNYSIVYNNYDLSKEKWFKSSITSLFNNDVNVQLLSDGRKMHLFCHSIEDDTSIIFYFSRKERRSNIFEFSCINKHESNSRSNPIFFIDNRKVFCAWLKDNTYYEIVLREDCKDWDNQREYLINYSEHLYLINTIQNIKHGSIIANKSYILIDNDFNLLKPWEKKDFKASATSHKNSSESRNNISSGDLSSYVPFLLEEIAKLSESVKVLHNKLESISESKAKKDNNLSSSEKNNNDDDYSSEKIKSFSPQPIKLKKKTNFKENFMKSNSFMSTPATAMYVGSGMLKDTSNNVTVAPQTTSPSPTIKESDENDKNTSSSDKKIDEIENKQEGIIKKLGEFFK